MYPKVGALASKADKLFVRGVTAYMQGNYGEALTSFKDVQARDAADRHIAEEFFAGLSLVGLGRNAEAVRYLEAVLASDYPIPDPLMAKYGVGGSMEIGVTPAAMAIVPMSNLATALILAEVYQELDQPQRAIELLESLGSHAPDEPVFALSLADLYFEADQWDNVVRVTEGIRENEDDVSLNIIILRASALNELRMHEGALALINEALRSKKRNPRLLLFARYVRGRAYETAGKARMARKEYEKVYAEDSTYQDVSERLGRGTSPSTDAPPRPDV